MRYDINLHFTYLLTYLLLPLPFIMTDSHQMYAGSADREKNNPASWIQVHRCQHVQTAGHKMTYVHFLQKKNRNLPSTEIQRDMTKTNR